MILRGGLVAARRRYDETIEAIEADNRRLVADLAQVAAEQGGLSIAQRMNDAALEAAKAAARDNKCGRLPG